MISLTSANHADNVLALQSVTYLSEALRRQLPTISRCSEYNAESSIAKFVDELSRRLCSSVFSKPINLGLARNAAQSINDITILIYLMKNVVVEINRSYMKLLFERASSSMFE